MSERTGESVIVISDAEVQGLAGGLDADQQRIVREYMRPHTGPQTAPPKNYHEYMVNHAKFMVDYLKKPEDFEPTDIAKQSAYAEFVLRRFDGKHAWPREVDVNEIDWNRLRNVHVGVDWHYSSTAGRKTVVQTLEAESRKDNGSKWEDNYSGRIAFSLEDWVQPKGKGLKGVFGKLLKK